eukprot:4234790-Pyramimonas_sp.AAC.2
MEPSTEGLRSKPSTRETHIETLHKNGSYRYPPQKDSVRRPPHRDLPPRISPIGSALASG